MASDFLGIDERQASILASIATIVLVLITAWYAILTSRLSKSTKEAADAAARSANASEVSAQVATTPILVETHGLEVDRRDGSVRYVLLNTGFTPALNVSTALIRYPFQGEPVETKFQHLESYLRSGETSPAPHELHRWPVNEAIGDIEEWRSAIASNSFGLVVLFTDIAGRKWRAEMRTGPYPYKLERIGQYGPPE